MSDIFTSDEDVSVDASNVTVEETNEESAESADESVVIRRPKKRIVRRIVDSDSESNADSEDGETEKSEDQSNSSEQSGGKIEKALNSDSDEDDVEVEKSEIISSDVENQTKSSTSIASLQEKTNKTESDVDDDDEAERRAFSPKTRKSIGGFFRPDSFTDEDNSESEIDYSSEEDSQIEESMEAINASRNKSFNSVSDTVNGNVSSDKFLQHEESNGNVASDKSLQNRSVPPNLESPAQSLNKNKLLPRYTEHFDRRNAKASLLSSTICEDPADGVASNVRNDENKLESSSHSNDENKSGSSSHSSDDVQVISVNNEPIDLSSSVEMMSPVKTEMVQPKIKKAISQIPPPPLKPPRSAKKSINAATKIVSKEFYDKECKKLFELKQSLQEAENLAANFGSNLPDGGRSLLFRCERLRLDIDVKTKFVESLILESEVLPKTAAAAAAAAEIPSWEALSQGVNEVQPTHTGARGLKTFNDQKALTAERLKDLHGSLESRPKENELADTPKGMKIELMQHQRHALKWMEWREKQNPHGGILADDMGLGKTLSMIALVLAAKNRREIHGSSGEDDSDDEEESGGWTSKGRRTKYNGGTLVICPASLVNQWEGEVKRHILSQRLSIIVHHGPNRDTKPKHLRTYDMVITTYAIVSREHKVGGAVFGLKWRRIILDEGHVIRNYKAQMSIAACELRGTFRWILTGTPVQNKELDVFALLKFLRCSPFDDLPYWQRWIAKSQSGQDRMRTVLQTLLLRRTKEILQERGELNCLPNKEVKLVEVRLDKDEMNVYQKVMAYSRTLFAQFLFQRAERNTDLNFIHDAARPSYMQKQDPNGAYYKLHEKFTRMHAKPSEVVKSHEILMLLLRLRQICCHPGLIDAMLEDDIDVSSDSDRGNTSSGDIDLLEELNKLTISDGRNDSRDNGAISKASAKVMQRGNPVFDMDRCSSKMIKVMEIIQHILTKTRDKVIIVSQWSSVLRILKDHLAKRNMATVIIDGSVPVKNRQAIVDDFNRESSSNRIMLLSLTAGGVGLNLVGANHILLVDLHWNPQLEAQAQDRIYRVGQKKDVIIYKFMCVETIEQSIKALQDRKLTLATGVLSGTKADKGSQLSLNDMRVLFEM